MTWRTTARAAMPPGSHLTITNLTADFMDPDQAARATQAGQQGGITYVPRSQVEVAAFFGGLHLIDPGVVPMQAWLRTPPPRQSQAPAKRYTASAP